MASHLTPDFRSPRGSGDHLTPDSGSPRGTVSRGTYPQDNGGPPDGPPQRIGQPRSTGGDPFTPATPANKQVDPKPPRKTTSANTTSNPLK